MLAHGNIFLTGFMGSGKSTLGKKLALVFRKEFVDLDRFIEKESGQSISEIFNTLGEDEFRKLEKRCLHKVLETHTKSVISLGGGSICFFDNLETVKQNGLLIYLQLPPKVLAERLKKSKTVRPLVQNLKSEDLLQSIEDKLAARLKFYEQAHLIVNGLNLTAQLLQHNIIEFQKKNIS